MVSSIALLVLLPLIGFLISLAVSGKGEDLILRVAFSTVCICLAATIAFLSWWLSGGHPPVDEKSLTLFSSRDFNFFIDFYFDKITAAYLAIGTFVIFLAVLFSHSYLHGEKGYKRFFNSVLLFYFGYNLTILSGNFETMFIGWEILAVASFFLIAFHQEEYLPVKNATRFFSVYRIGDAGLALAMWSSRHLWRGNVTFLKLGSYGALYGPSKTDGLITVLIPVLLLATAFVKSAQWPFSSWLPRAIESSVPAGAILYGFLSLHLGIFLLLRTSPFWEQLLPARILISISGLSTAAIATGISRVQPAVKSQIAYASIAQTGLIFIEIAAGFKTFALFHFAGNVLFRTYQMFTSSTTFKSQANTRSDHFVLRSKLVGGFLTEKARNTLYMLSIKEWSLDLLVQRYLWSPLKRIISHLNFNGLTPILVLLFIGGLSGLCRREIIPQNISACLPSLFSLIGLILVLKSFTERLGTQISWLFILMNHCWTALAISLNERFSPDQVSLYLGGVVVSGVTGSIVLRKLKLRKGGIRPDQFHGHSVKHPGLALIFLLCSLGISGFPVTPAFIGERVLFSHIHQNQIILASIITLSLILNSIAAMRIYARLFLGRPTKTIGEMAYRSS